MTIDCDMLTNILNKNAKAKKYFEDYVNINVTAPEYEVYAVKDTLFRRYRLYKKRSGQSGIVAPYADIDHDRLSECIQHKNFPITSVEKELLVS